MSKSLHQPESTYRATYRGSTIVLAHANKSVSEPVAQRMAKDIDWMLRGDINVRLYTMHNAARRQLMQYIPSNVCEQHDSSAHLLDLPDLITHIAKERREEIEELIVLSNMAGFHNGHRGIMPLLSNTKIDALRAKHRAYGPILDAVEAGLESVPKIVFTQPRFLGDEIQSVTGKGTMCFNRSATTYGPLHAREIPIFMGNYRRQVEDGTYRTRTTAELRRARDEHEGIRVGRSLIGGFSLTPQDQKRLSLELVWGCSRGGDLGSLILDHATQAAGRSSFYALTIRQEVAQIFRNYPGMLDVGTMSHLQENGEIHTYAPEHANYNTEQRDPHFFWHPSTR